MKKLFLLTILFLGVTLVQAQSNKRQIRDKVFVPKDQWIVGGTLAYSEHSEDNYNFLIVEKFNSNGYSFKVSPLLAYAVKDNLVFGTRFSYGRNLTDFDAFSLGLGDDLEIKLKDTRQLSNKYMAMGIMRNYIPLGDSKRFALYAETQIKFGGGKNKLVTAAGEEVTGTFSKSLDMGIGLTPGIVAFINNYTAVEVSVGVLGFDFRRTNFTTDQIYHGEKVSSAANFRINLFSIGLGLAFYL